MAIISFDRLIFAIGGFDYNEMAQIGSIEIYEVQSNEWKTGILKDLNIPRSQAGALLLNSRSIYVFGGYSKSMGILNSIEHLDLETKENELIELIMPIPLRRFECFKVSDSKIILVGGLTKESKRNDDTYIIDLFEKKSQKGMKLVKGGALEHEIIFE